MKSKKKNIGLCCLTSSFFFLVQVALLMIVFFGGELFTGNTMYMTAGLLHGKVSWKGLAYSWFCSYFANWMGCALGAYLFGYVTELFVHDPWLTNVKYV